MLGVPSPRRYHACPRARALGGRVPRGDNAGWPRAPPHRSGSRAVRLLINVIMMQSYSDVQCRGSAAKTQRRRGVAPCAVASPVHRRIRSALVRPVERLVGKPRGTRTMRHSRLPAHRIYRGSSHSAKSDMAPYLSVLMELRAPSHLPAGRTYVTAPRGARRLAEDLRERENSDSDK